MAFSYDISLPGDHCEICGADLSNEVVIQDFADGSIAHLCGECAAGAALTADASTFRFPDPSDDSGALDMSADDGAAPALPSPLALETITASAAPAPGFGPSYVPASLHG